VQSKASTFPYMNHGACIAVGSGSHEARTERLREGSNPSIERTHNGGAQCPAPSRAVPPLCAAHVKR